MSEQKEPSALKRKLIPLQDTKNVTQHTKGAIKRLLSSVRSEREESFAEAKDRLNWSEQDIADFISYRKKEALIYAGLIAITFLFACASPYSSNPLTHLVTSLAVLLMVSSRLLVAHFRLTQLRHRALFSFKEYLSLLVFSSAVNTEHEQVAPRANAETQHEENANVVELTKSKQE